VIYAEGSIRIDRSVIGRGRDGEVAVYGCETVTLAEDVWVHGKVAAGKYVMAA
jgi:hypothetical protein